MKIIKYKYCVMVNHGTEDKPNLKQSLLDVQMPWSTDTEEIAKAEAYNGKYTIEDDGAEEPTESTQEERISELEEALELLLSGVTE